MDIIFSVFESFSLSSETILFILPFLVLLYYTMALFGYKKFFIIFTGIAFFWVLSSFSWLAILLIVSLSICNFVLLRIYQQDRFIIFLWLGFLLNLSALILLKYMPTTINMLNDFTHFIGFIGISFYVFHVWSVFMDIYNKKIMQPLQIGNFLAFLLYFPKIITGPLVRYNDFIEELSKETMSESFAMQGIALFMYGLFIKAIADYISLYPSNIYSNPQGYSGFEHLSAMYGYAVYIFLDFSAYTNMARGISRLFGIELPVNFLSPYRSFSIIDFWRRWHISLSNWIRDYIYIPLGGSRKGTFRMYLNLFGAFFLSGLWHGVGLQYAIWGLIHGFGIVVNKFFTDKLSLPWIIAWFVTFHWVCLSWIFFANPIDTAFLSLLKIFTDFDTSIIVSVLFNNATWYSVLLITFIFSLWDNFILTQWLKIFVMINFFLKIIFFWLLLWFVLVSHQGSVNTFIYQNF